MSSVNSGTLIVVGSNELEQANSVEYYNPDVDEWTKILNLDIDRTQYKSIVLDEKLIFTGGLEGNQESPTVQSYDFNTGVMTILPQLKYPRHNHVVSVVARHLYVIGGMGSAILNSVERYSPFTNTWTDVMPLLTNRSTPGVTMLNGEIFVIGGFDVSQTELASVESYNPIIGTWTKCADMNERRDDPAVAVIGKFIYVVGGRDPSETLKTAERYEPVLDRWTYIHAMSVPRFRCKGCFYNGSLIIAGGENTAYEALSTVESYNVNNNTWTTLAPLVAPRTRLSLVEVPWNYIPPRKPKV